MLTVIIADSKQLTLKSKPVIYTKAFAERYHWKNREQVYEIDRIIQLKNMDASITKNSHNLNVYWIIEILLAL